ncbi:MAG: hypothetical protein WBW99_18670, partial [Pseudolabrys sp.]
KNTAPAIQLKPAGKNEEAYAASTLNRVASELAATSEGHRDSTLMSVTAPYDDKLNAVRKESKPVSEKQRRLWQALHEYITRQGGWVVSIPGV